MSDILRYDEYLRYLGEYVGYLGGYVGYLGECLEYLKGYATQG